MDSRPVQREKTERPDDPGEVQHLPLRGLQGKSNRLTDACDDGERENGRYYQLNERRTALVDKWLEFYRPYFTESSDLEQFVQACEGLEVHDPRHRAKIMMHQGRRLLSIADRMEIVEPGYEPLKLLFLLICAENISKLNVSTKESNKSKYHVKRFFCKFCSPSDKQEIVKNIEICQKHSTFEGLIEILYDVRCDVVHEGHYWGFNFATDEHPSMLTGANAEQVLRVHIKYEKFRDIVARGVIAATSEVLNA